MTAAQDSAAAEVVIEGSDRRTIVATGAWLTALSFAWALASILLFAQTQTQMHAQALLAAGAGVAVLASTALALRGANRAGAAGLVLAVWGTVTLSLLARGSLASVSGAGLLVVFVLAFSLLGARGALLGAGLSTITALLLLAGLRPAWLEMRPTNTSVELLAGYMTYLVVLAALGALLLRRVREREQAGQRRARLLRLFEKELLIPTGAALSSDEAFRELRRLIVENHRFALIGRAAAGVTHDFRNLLMVVRSELELTGDEKDTDEGVRNALAASERAIEMANRTLQLLGEAAPRHVPLELGSLVRKLEALLVASVASSVRLRIEVPTAESVWVAASENELTRVLLNLCLNAAEAMPGGGALRVCVERGRDADGRHCGVIEVVDTGTGMSEEVARRAFEPLVSTRREGAGGGLGLAIVAGIVAAHEGRVSAHAAEVKGTRVRVELPLLLEAGPS